MSACPSRPCPHLSRLAIVAACAIVGAIANPAAAQERFAGHWAIAGAVVAPWASDLKDAADEADAKRLIGSHLTIAPHVFNAPEPLGCARPTYAFRNAAADGLFEGSLNADGAGKPADPVVAARALGMNQKMARAMTASCSEVEFVLIDPDTVLFGLNNRVFTVKREK
ncbi:hypothetical protein [Methylocapsa sp. S129]|uniref:hypothetical protein n=1 Tax=Methylocapsa sp. S129 TaxID=1641869 RepID=UPI00131B2162|nr:hypothetical protein [Methylocapsa sp. S129]